MIILLKASHLIISESESLFEVFDHLFDLPSFGIILDHIDGGEVEMGRDQIDGFLTFLFYPYHGHLTYSLDLPDHLSHLKGSILPVQMEGDLPIKRLTQETLEFSLFPLYPEDRIGFELRDHVIAFPSTEFNQFFAPIPTIHEEIEFTGSREFKALNHPFRQRRISLRLICHIDFCMKGATSSGSLGMVELRPQGEEEVSVKEGRKHPLVAKDPDPLLSRISIPGASRDFLSTFLNQCIIDKKEKDRVGFDMKGLEEVLEFDSGDFFHRPDVL